MTYKELSPQEVAKMLSENPDGFDGYVKVNEEDKWKYDKVIGINYMAEFPICAKQKKEEGYGFYNFCAVRAHEPYPDNEVPNLKCGDVIVHKQNGKHYLVTMIDYENEKGYFVFTNQTVSNASLFNYYRYLDGTPIGRKVGSE